MIPNHKGEIPAVVLLLPFLPGISFGLNLLPQANATGLTIAFVSLSAVFIILNLNYSRYRLYKNRWVGGSLIVLILFLFGWLSAVTYSELRNNDHFSKKPAQYLVVKITDEPVLKNGLVRFTADVAQAICHNKKTTTSGTLLISIKDSAAKRLYYGDELLIPAKYSSIDRPFNPAEFNYKKYLADKNIYYQAVLYPKQFAILSTNTGNPLIAHALRLRQRLVEKLKQNIHDTAAYAVASTLILGYRADLSSDVLQAYSKTGTVYVLSVSGAQVAIIYLLLSVSLKFLNRYRYGSIIRAIIIVGVIWYYGMLTGFSMAVCRVAVMVSMVTIGKAFNRYINTLNILAISAFVLLLYDPFFITEVGFQLSFIAVSGLIILQPIVYNWLKFKNKWADKVWAVCSVSIAAQVVTFPVSAFYFHQFPVYFLISNLFVVVPASLIMYAGIFYLLLPQIPVISRSLALVMEKTIVLLNKGLTVIEHWPYASINKIWLTMPEYLLLYVIIISLFYFLYDRKVWLLKASLLCILLLCMSISVKKMRFSHANNIAWLNLKKHYGIVFKNGNNATVITDLKNTDKVYQYSIQPYLDSCEISHVSVFNLSQDINSPYLLKKRGLVQFLNKRILIFDKQVQNVELSQKLAIDYVYFTGNPHAALDMIDRNFDCRMLVADGSNPDKLTREIEKYAENKRLNCKILKSNNSFISVSN
jgi:competence protein ComEC